MAPLGNRYTRVWTASSVSNLGDGVLIAALPLIASTLTDDPVAIAGLGVATGLPWLAFGLLAGVVVDRVDRRRLMVAVDVARAVILGAAALAIAGGWASMPVLYAVAFLLGVGETLFDTASQTILPSLVAPDRLEQANGRLFGAQLVTNAFLGPPLGGVLFAAAAIVPLALDAASFGVSALVLATLAGRFRAGRTRARGGILGDVREGLGWLWSHRTVRALAIGAAVINVGQTAAMAVLVLHARRTMDLAPAAYGLLLAGGAVGSVAGTMLVARAVRAVGRARALCLAVAATAAGLAVLGGTSEGIVAGAALAVIGAGSEVWNVVAVSYRQAAVPDELLGRVMSSYRTIAYGSVPVGAALGGFLARSWGLRAPFLAAAVVTLALVGYLGPVLARDPLDARPAVS